MRKRIAAVTLSVWLTNSLMTHAAGWRGIVPLKSACKDVKLALKVDKCVIPMSEYHIPDFRVVIFFSEGKRRTNQRGQRVAPGVVTSLVISPKREMPPAEFGIDISKLVKLAGGDVVGAESYESHEEGITVNLFNGFVQEIHFYPPAKGGNIRCKPAESNQRAVFQKLAFQG